MYSFTNCGRLKQSDIKVIIPTFFFRYPGYPREYKRVSLVTNCRLFFKSNIKVKISFNFLHDFLISHFNCCDWKFFRILLEQNFGKNKLCLQINLCQKLLFLHQLTHNMTTDCSLIYQFSTWKFQAQNMGRKWWEHVVYTNCFFVLVLTFRTIYVHNMFSWCSELGIFMYSTGKSMNNLLSYCGLIDAKIRASDKDLPVHRSVWKPQNTANYRKLPQT